MNFERNIHAPDGVHEEICYFNELRIDKKLQSSEELRERLKEMLGTVAAAVIIIGGFVAAGIVEAL